MDGNRTVAAARDAALAAVASETEALVGKEEKVNRAIEEAREALLLLSGVFGQIQDKSNPGFLIDGGILDALNLPDALGDNRGLSAGRRDLARLAASVQRLGALCAEASVDVVFPTLPPPRPRGNRWSRAFLDFAFAVVRSDHRRGRLEEEAHTYRRAIDAALLELQHKRRALAATRTELAARQARLTGEV
jgi:hypothetical protein